MVEVDIQFLAGVAVTVFLALIFFAVVVLWDISLALRSVGDKIDKLEDNLDDDLKDIGYGINTLSNTPGGGTQLHLNSGGSISSGPQGSPAQGTNAAGPEQHHTAQSEHGPTRDGARSPRDGMNGQATRPEGTDEGVATANDGPGVDAVGTENDVSSEPSGDTPPSAAENESVAEGVSSDDDSLSASAVSTDDDSASVTHPNATRNRGRFIASPDRTPWYRTPLDREAIAAGNSTPIAGALESPAVIDEDDDDDDDGAQTESEDVSTAGDTSSREDDGDTDQDSEAESEDRETEASAVYAAPPAHSSDNPEAIDAEAETGTGQVTETESALEEGAEAALEDVTGSASTAEAGADVRAGVDAAEPLADKSSDSDKGSASGSSRSITFDEDRLEAESAEGSDSEPLEKAEGAVGDRAGDTSDGLPGLADSTAETDDGTDGGDDEGPNETDDTVHDADASGTDGSEDTDTDSDQHAEASEASEEASATDSDGPDPIPLDDALEALTEGGPELTFSSHGFDVSSVVDEDAVVLTFEFDPETVEIQGSTKRLLTYQLQSFADQASTPEGDVTIGEQRIVIEIPDADGNAIEQWGEAAVTSIDRTLYLSDSE